MSVTAIAEIATEDEWPDLAEEDRRLVEQPPPAALVFQSAGNLATWVDAQGPRRWLVRGIWPVGAYGVHGAEPKAGKTWNALDLACSVASGTPWLGSIPVDQAGPVMVFAGEGGGGNLIRRMRAICSSRGLDLATLPIFVCLRAPHLTNIRHLAEFQAALQVHKPVLAIIDPLYLAARGASGSDLYQMGAVLEEPQRLAEAAGCALLVVTHFNRSRDLKGAARFTGAGPAEWGRVLIASAVISRHTDPETLRTTVLTDMEITGGEVPDQLIRVKRDIHAEDPDDLASPLTYEVTTLAPDQNAGNIMTGGDDLPPAARKLLQAVTDLGEPAESRAIVDQVEATHGHGLKRETVSRELNKLLATGLVDCIDQGAGKPKLWLKAEGVTNP